MRLRRRLAISLLLLPSALAETPLHHLATRALQVGTHRPELLALPGGGVMVVVVQPEGRQGIGQIKHQAYRFDADWKAAAGPFVVTRVTAEFGEPADHRAAIVNGELVVIYQSLIFKNAAPQSGPAEVSAQEQSLMMARFTLAGEEIDRRPIVAHVTDFSQDNFPDFCILWRGPRFFVSAGSTGRTLKIREVDLNAAILGTRALQSSPLGIGGTLGNSLLHDGSRLFLLSATGPDSGDLTLTEMDADLQPVTTLRMSDPAREQNFPVGNLLDAGALYVSYIARDRGGPPGPEQNPYSPWLKLLGQDFETVQDLQLGEGGFLHVHPTVTRSGNRLLVAWSKAVPGGPGQAPQVQIEEFELPAPER
jgi:hypothetical protein